MTIQKLPGCNKLQPHFTKDSPKEKHRKKLQHNDQYIDYKENVVNRKLWIQYQFEFPPNLLDDDDSKIGGSQRNAPTALPRNNDMIESDSNSSFSSIISQITQDTSLQDDDYDDEMMTGVMMGDYGDDSCREQKPNSRALDLLEKRKNMYVATTEVQDGARLLLNLFSAQ